MIVETIEAPRVIRAQAAERIASDLQQELEATQDKLRRSEAAVEEHERRRELDELLVGMNVVDLDVGRLLTELEMATQEDLGAADAAEDLRRRKPFLFGRSITDPRTLSPHGTSGTAETVELARAAGEASVSGRRQDLLRYLRLRRRRGSAPDSSPG